MIRWVLSIIVALAVAGISELWAQEYHPTLYIQEQLTMTSTSQINCGTPASGLAFVEVQASSGAITITNSTPFVTPPRPMFCYVFNKSGTNPVTLNEQNGGVVITGSGGTITFDQSGGLFHFDGSQWALATAGGEGGSPGGGGDQSWQDTLTLNDTHTLPVCGTAGAVAMTLRPPGVGTTAGSVEACYDPVRGVVLRLLGGSDPGCLFLQNFRHCGVRASAPAETLPGDVYIDTTTTVKFCIRKLDNTGWTSIPSGGDCT